MDEELVSDSLIYRYDPTASPDGLRGSEGTFHHVQLLVRRRARPFGSPGGGTADLREMLTYSSHLGLYPEEIAPTGEQIGNFPQAFSHLALITAAMNLDYQLGHGAGFVEPGARSRLRRDVSGSGRLAGKDRRKSSVDDWCWLTPRP